MTDVEQRAAAKHFAEYWQGKGYEKGQSQPFWLSLLSDVFGVEHAAEYIKFEDQVHLDHTSFIDGFIPATKVLIEQKSLGKSLTAPIPQSDGSLLSPLQQAQRYVFALLQEMGRQAVPRWVVTCNFEEFRVYDLDHPQNEAQVIKLADLPTEYYRLKFLVDTGNENLKREMELSLKAGELVGVIHDRFLEQYSDPMAVHTQRSLNKLCVRLVFCLYAEDAGLFGATDAFSKYISQFEPQHIRRALIDLFKVLDTKPEDRDEYLDDELAAFPYVNGGLFQDENIVIPKITEAIKQTLLESAQFDWSDISPTIFGAVFESTLNPETRRSGGMHYTSIENIHKVIDPLLLDDLKAELAQIKSIAIPGDKTRKLKQYQQKLANLTFLDPACGSGNFLTETYLCLRRLENEVLSELNKGQVMFADEATSPIQVSISQFYGIEINDFAVTVAKTALWIAESQMMKETEDVVLIPLDFLPLKTNACIIEGNALRIDWNRIISKDKLNYIMGNPPFVGYTYQSRAQKEDIQAVSPGIDKTIDYVAMWYIRAAQYIAGTNIHVALVSTNSVCQGEQVLILWKPLIEQYHLDILFAHKTFRWDSEASIKAHVHCVIIGFCCSINNCPKTLFSPEPKTVHNISPYLIDAPTVFIDKRSKPICDIPKMYKGSQATDGGNLVLNSEERNELLAEAPELEQYIHLFVGSDEYINKRERYCLWLVHAEPIILRQCKPLRERLERVKEMRLASTKAATRQWANKPYLFTENRQPNTTYIIVPSVSSEQRRYVPIGFVQPDIIASNLALIIPEAELFHFGVLTSNVHMAWMRTVCGRLEMRYRYSNTIVYNNFPWCEPTEEQKAKIEQTAQAILDARALYPDSSLADLYDELTMPPELRTAHQKNDRAVMEAYGFWGKLNSESECVAELMKMYQELTTNRK